MTSFFSDMVLKVRTMKPWNNNTSVIRMETIYILEFTLHTTKGGQSKDTFRHVNLNSPGPLCLKKLL